MSTETFRETIGKLLLAAGALTLAVGAAELAWRHLHTAHFGPGTNPGYVLFDGVLGWRYRSNAHVRHRSAEFDVAIDTDGAGRRVGASCGRGLSPPSTPRIAFLGDSFTFGWGVEAEETYPCLVGRDLGVEVLNFAVAGYSTDQESVLFDEQVLVTRPAAVVLQVSRNDLEEALSGVRYGRPKPRIRLLPEGALEVSPARDRALVFDRFSALLLSLRYFAGHTLASPPTPAEQAAGVALISGLVDRLAARTAAAGGCFVLLSDRVDWLDPSSLEVATGSYLDVGPVLAAAAAGGERTEIPGYGHWSRAGHRLVAAELIRALLPCMEPEP